MPYSFSQHMEQLADDPKMQDLVIQYYNAFGHDVADELESQPFYTNYIQFFRPLGSKLRVPRGLEDQFNWDLFCQFAAASVSTQVSLERNPDNSNQIQMGISAKHEKLMMARYLHDLSLEVVQSTFEIYVLEQMQMELISKEFAVRGSRKIRLDMWRYLLSKY